MKIRQMKPKVCEKCEEPRNVTIIPKVAIASMKLELTYRRLCIPCFISTIDLAVPGKNGEYNYDKAMNLAPKQDGL